MIGQIKPTIRQVLIVLGLALCIMVCSDDVPVADQSRQETAFSLADLPAPTPTPTPSVTLADRPTPTPKPSVQIGRKYPHILGTHCGIKHARFGGREWQGHPPPALSGPNPPPGWGNALGGNGAKGVMMLVEPDLARFTNDATGEQVDFTPWPPDRGPYICF